MPVGLADEAIKALMLREKINGHPANRTSKMFARHGIIGAMSRTILKSESSDTFKQFQTAGAMDFTFEAIALRWKSHFSAEVIAAAERRLAAVD